MDFQEVDGQVKACWLGQGLSESAELRVATGVGAVLGQRPRVRRK